MPHTCDELNCNYNVFGGGKCKYHQFKRRMQYGDLYKKKAAEARSPKSGTRIPKESKTRKKDHIHYAQHCKELTQEIRNENNGKIFCFFSGLEIQGTVSYHHLKGRTGVFYTDKEWLVPVDNKYHLMFHFTTVEELMKEPWYEGFLKRLRFKSEELYQKELKKIDKSGILFQDEDEEIN